MHRCLTQPGMQKAGPACMALSSMKAPGSPTCALNATHHNVHLPDADTRLQSWQGDWQKTHKTLL